MKLIQYNIRTLILVPLETRIIQGALRWNPEATGIQHHLDLRDESEPPPPQKKPAQMNPSSCIYLVSVVKGHLEFWCQRQLC